MTPRYSALIQLVDYVTSARHVAVGDMLCVRGAWKKVTRVDAEAPIFYVAHVEDVGSVSIYPDSPVARIPGVLLELLNQTGDPYR